MKNNSGFTLLELLIVIAIILIISAAIVTRIGSGNESARISKVKAEMEEIASAERVFYHDTGYWIGKNNMVRDDCGLMDKNKIIGVVTYNGSEVIDAAIIQEVKNKWKGPYLEGFEFPYDPWGGYSYSIIRIFTVNLGVSTGGLYVYCLGPDRVGGGWDWQKMKPAGNSDDIAILVHRW